MQDRILLPFCLKLFYDKTLEKMLLSSEICLKSRYKKVFTEPSWTTEEVIFSGACQSMYQVGLIHIYISVQPQIFKILYSNRIFHTQLHLIQPINIKKLSTISKSIMLYRDFVWKNKTQPKSMILYYFG